MAAGIFSIDIRDDVVSGVVLSPSSGNGANPTAWAAVATNGRSLAESLTELVRQVGFAGGTCRISFAAREFFFANLSLPFSDKKKINQVLPFELEDISPVGIEKMAADAVVGGLAGAETAVLAAMLPRDFLTARLAQISESGLDPEIVSVSGVALAARIARLPGTQADFVLLEMEARQAALILVRNRRLVLIRPLTFDAGERRADCRFDVALLQPVVTSPEVLSDAFSALVSAIRRTLRAAVGEMPCPPCYLSGPGARLPGLAAAVKEGLGAEVREIDLMQTFPGDGNSDGWSPGAMNQALAMGLRQYKAADGFNFRKGALEPPSLSKGFGFLRSRFRVTALLAVVILCLLAYDFISHKVEENRLTDRIRTVFVNTLPNETRIVRPVAQLQAEVDGMRHNGDLGIGGGDRVLDLIAEISRRIPTSVNVHLSRMVMDDNGIRLRGTAGAFTAVDRIKKELEKSPYFQSVTITSANLAPEGERIVFDIKILVNGS